MTPLDQFLSAIEEVEKKATPGPWIRNGTGGYICYHQIEDDRILDYISSPNSQLNETKPDAEFIAASRSAIPQLLEIVRIQQEALKNILHKNSHKASRTACEDREIIENALAAVQRVVEGENK